MKQITVTIDHKTVAVPQGSSILDAASRAGISIPTLCHDERVKPYGACGLCVVEVENSPKLLRACATQASDGMVVFTQSKRVNSSRKFALEMLLSDHLGDCIGPCQKACPAKTDCQGYVGLIANGEYTEAARLIQEKIPFPASIGRICPHPCEDACRRKLVEDPIAIAALKRFAGDYVLEHPAPLPEIAADSGKQIAIVGGGPGGLTAAYFLRQQGHAVTVFDMMPQMGGMLQYGIPEYRLPKAVLQAEIARISALGVTLQNNMKLGRDMTLEGLRKEYDAVILAIGAWASSKMRVAGEDLQGVYGGIDFLRETVLGNPPEIGQRVAVCGGGNTAMDACRTAVRLGAKEVFILYRRTRDEMPADHLEIEEAMEEGVQFLFLTNPTDILGEDGRVTGIRLQKMALGEPDASGRRRPVPIEGALEDIALDSVIMAIGQAPNTDGLGDIATTRWNTIVAAEDSYTTNLEGVFAIGDATNNGADIAISAIGEAVNCVPVVERYLAGNLMPNNTLWYCEQTLTEAAFTEEETRPRKTAPVASPTIRKHNFKEVASCFSAEDARKEAQRCLECGCLDYHECKLIHYARQYNADPSPYQGQTHTEKPDFAHPYIRHDFNKCVLCGLCVRVCHEVMGVTALGMAGRGFSTVVSPEFGNSMDVSACVSCGQCITLCPTGALCEKVPFQKDVPLQEKRTQTTCSGCAVGCQMEVRTVGNLITRAVPAGDGIACAQGRFGFGDYNNPMQPAPQIAGKAADHTVAIQALRDALSACDDLIILLSEALTNEDADCAVQLAAQYSATVFRFTPKQTLLEQHTDFAASKVFGNLYGKGANYRYLQDALQLPPYDPTKISAQSTVLVLGADAPMDLPATAKHIVCGYTPKHTDLFFPAIRDAQREGSYIDGRKLRAAIPLQECYTVQKLAAAL